MAHALPIAALSSTVPVGLVLSLLPALAAQNPPAEPGFNLVLHHTASGPYSVQLAAAGLNGHVIAALGNVLADLPGNSSALPLHSLPATDFIGAMTRERGRDVIWFTSYSSNALFSYDLNTQQLRTGSCPKNTYDVEVQNGLILASANPTWPATGAAPGIWAVDFLGGQHKEIVRLPGASGPVAFAANGDVVVGVVSDLFPPPAKSASILRFARSKIDAARGSGPRLAVTDAAAALTMIDNIFDLVLDGRDRIYWSDGSMGGVGRTRAGQLVVDPAWLIPANGLGTLSLSWIGKGPGSFDAYQPADAGTLCVLASDWAATCRVYTVSPKRADIYTSPGPIAPPGPVAIAILDAAPGAALAVGLSPALPLAEQVVLTLAGIPVLWGLDTFLPTLWLPTTVAVDGRARVDLVHPGGFAASLGYQAAFVLGTGLDVRCGTTPARVLQLQK